jgi:hypothetical protein
MIDGSMFARAASGRLVFIVPVETVSLGFKILCKVDHRFGKLTVRRGLGDLATMRSTLAVEGGLIRDC